MLAAQRPVVAFVASRHGIEVRIQGGHPALRQRAGKRRALIGGQRAAREVGRDEFLAVAGQLVIVQDRLVDLAHVQPGRHLQGQGRLECAQPLHGVQPQGGDLLRHPDFLVEVARQPVDADQRGLGAPIAGLGAGQLEFRRHLLGICLDPVHVGVDAIREGGKNGAAFGVIAGELGLHVAAEQEEARRAVLLDEARAELLGHLAFTLAAPQVKLPQTVARGAETLGKEQIILVLRINVRYAVLVPHDLHGLGQPCHVDRVLLAAWRGAAGRQDNQPARQHCGDPAIKSTHGSSSGLLLFCMPARPRGVAHRTQMQARTTTKSDEVGKSVSFDEI
ncbi:hypothetical protein D3C86_983910 [compost metagenome]